MAQQKKKTGRTSASQTTKRNRTSGKAAKTAAVDKQVADRRVLDEIWGVIFIALGIFLFAAIQFHAAGQLGNMIGDVLKGIFGLVGLLLPWYLIAFGILLFIGKTVHINGKSFFLVFLILLMLCLLNSGRFIESEHLVYPVADFYKDGISLKGGGFFGMILGTFLVKIIGRVGLYVLACVVVIICLLLVVNTPVSRSIERMAMRAEERRLQREAASEEREARREEFYQEQQMNLFAKDEQDVKIITPFDDAGPLGRGEKKKGKGIKSNVLKYMNDKNLFAEEKEKTKSASLGLDTAAPPERGLGLDGAPPVSGYGLDGAQTPDRTESGFGLSENSFVHVDKGEKQYGLEPVPGVIRTEEPTKLSKKEASSISLDPSEMSLTKHTGRYKKPSISLLNKPTAKNRGNINTDLKMKAVKLEETLKNFHVDAKVVQVTQGPAVTRYEIQPNVGVKVSSIVRLADDIALNLEAKSIRIEAPIPGKAAVGIEVENDKINMVTLREIIDSDAFKSAESKITFAVGKDIAGKAIVADLKGMPHLLIAGSTGSGKSVCINSIITSILYKADPDEVKLVLIDPKVVELGNYNGIPHLLIPVVTEPTKAAAALNWAVAEMTDRYKKFAENQVRDLESYNGTMRLVGEEDQVMPQIVIIIDELADLMMAAPSQVEESICRLAQMARAAGMHLIVATQRPSVDIITGVIKANIPSRIAFAVSSQFDSRTILDMSGAEKLVGKGDMLFNPLGMGKPVRVQGTFVSDSEVHNVIEHVKAQVEQVEYSGEVINTIEKGNLPQTKDDDGDELLAEAIECVVSAGQASVSMLQRRFRIGYNRAARIVDMMEARGIVGPQDGSRPRQVLVTEEELSAMKDEVENT
ncbi:MAG: DNA translocase FtsK 4TM domain-containing protein [Emergencia sp.]